MHCVTIIQARMGSERLPGKVLMSLGGETVLSQVVKRVRHCKVDTRIVIATTDRIDDQLIVDEAQRLGVDCYRGSETDVLSRYYHAAEMHHAEIVTRITADCPLLDDVLLSEMLDVFCQKWTTENRIDYMTNTSENGYPRGLDVEIFSFDILKEAFEHANLEYEREHVTPYMYMKDLDINIEVVEPLVAITPMRLTLDAKEDFKLISAVYKELGKNGRYIDTKDVIDFLSKNDAIRNINVNVEQKRVC